MKCSEINAAIREMKECTEVGAAYFGRIAVASSGAYLYVQPLITVLLTVLAAMGTQRPVSRQKIA